MAGAAPVVVASWRKSGGEGGESGGEGSGVGFSVRRHSVICSSKVGDRGDCSSSAARAICSANVGERGDSSSTTGATVLQTGVGSVGGGATEIGDSFFRCAMRRGLMCALLIVDGAGSTSIRRRSASGRQINSATRCCTPSMALNSTGGSPNRACMTTNIIGSPTPLLLPSPRSMFCRPQARWRGLLGFLENSSKQE